MADADNPGSPAGVPDGERPKELLFFAYHFPPIQGSSGVHRTLAFAKFLPNYGWNPTVMTVHPRAYPNIETRNLDLVPKTLQVERCFALDTQRHLAIRGHYPAFLAVPDRWQSWVPSGILRGRAIIERKRPDLIMSTFPIASAHLIARSLHRRFGLPWVADLRDPMIFDAFPAPGMVRSSWQRIERTVFSEATAIIVTTPGAALMYKARYPEYAEKVNVVENGVDEDIFDTVSEADGRVDTTKLRLLHSGMIYPEARDPRPLLSAIARLVAEGSVSSNNFELIFRASGLDAYIESEVSARDLKGIVSVLPPIDYRDALSEMRSADALLVLQARSCNSQIPAKAYEYLACGKPILALTDPVGDTGTLLRNHGVNSICALEDRDLVERTVREFILGLSTNVESGGAELNLETISRRTRTRQLADLLNSVGRASRDV